MITRKEYEERILNCDYVGTMSSEYNEINLYEVKGIETALLPEIEHEFLSHNLKGYIDVSDKIYNKIDLKRILADHGSKRVLWAKEKKYVYQIFGAHKNGKVFNMYWSKDLMYHDVLHVDNIDKLLHRLRKNKDSVLVELSDFDMYKGCADVFCHRCSHSHVIQDDENLERIIFCDKFKIYRKGEKSTCGFKSFYGEGNYDGLSI